MVDNISDVVTENAHGGEDTILSSVSFNLPENVENLQLTGNPTTPISGMGNAIANVISGTTGANTLDGGNGVDMLSYQSGASSGVIVDLSKQGTSQITGGGGNDTLNHFENLTGSLYNDNLIGDDGKNILTGSVGGDTLTGGLGVDQFIYSAAIDTPATSYDVINDFSSTQKDLIDVSQFDSNLSADGIQHWILVTGVTNAAGQMSFNLVNQLISFDQQTGINTTDHRVVAAIKLTGVSAIEISDFILE